LKDFRNVGWWEEYGIAIAEKVLAHWRGPSKYSCVWKIEGRQRRKKVMTRIMAEVLRWHQKS